MSASNQSSPLASDAIQAPNGERPENAGNEVPNPTSGNKKSREDLVREAAYRRWEERGSKHGGHEDDWREAEEQVGPPEGN
jgi:hypothetical protein